MRIVRTKSIPNVDDDRLLGDIATLHDRFHTPEGLRAHDGPRRDMINNGMKIKKIASELEARGHPPSDCKFCQPPCRVEVSTPPPSGDSSC